MGQVQPRRVQAVDYGDFYAWGEIATKTTWAVWEFYKWMQSGQSEWKYITKYTIADGETEAIWYDSSGNFIGDNITTLVAADDAATQQLGSPWRMPTVDEINELLDKCTWTWTTQDGVNGHQVDGPNGNAIFLPATGYISDLFIINRGDLGYYWSSSLSPSSHDASLFYFDSVNHAWAYEHRRCGLSVRPVRP